MKKILVIVDAQNDFIDGALPNPRAQKCIPKIVKKIKNFDGDVIITTQDTHFDDYLETMEGKNLPVVHCVNNTDGWKINEKVATALAKRTDVTLVNVIKMTFGSFDLLQFIKNYTDGEEFEIEFCGFCTDICVVSNAMLTKAAFYNKANITVDAGCSASVFIDSKDERARQKAALKTMKACQINVVNE